MSLRVHLPQDLGLRAITCRDPISIADALRAELAFRQITYRELGRRIGKAHSSLGNYLRGEREFPPEVLSEILALLHSEGRFLIPGLAETGVIPTLDAPPGYPTLDTSPYRFPRPYGNAWIDTLWVNIDIPVEWQEPVHRHLQAKYTNAGRRHPAARQGDTDAYRLSPWKPVGAERKKAAPIVSHRKIGRGEKDWMRVQFKMTDPAQVAAYWKLADPLLFRRRAGCVRLKRIDFCVDYPVEPMRLVLQRPRARIYEWMTSFQGAHSIGIGRRGGPGVYLRCYDAAHVHDLPGPLTRVEVELRPDAALTWADFRSGFKNPFEALWVGTLTAPTLTSREVILLQQARVSGLTAFRKMLGSRERSEFDDAITKSGDAPGLRPAQDFHAKWVYMKEMLRHLLACA